MYLQFRGDEVKSLTEMRPSNHEMLTEMNQNTLRNNVSSVPASHGEIQVKRDGGDAIGGAASRTSNGDGDRWGLLRADKCPRGSFVCSYIWRGEWRDDVPEDKGSESVVEGFKDGDKEEDNDDEEFEPIEAIKEVWFIVDGVLIRL
ncbi:hypothetical protein Bca101_020520 [Brassica carinata]